MKFVPLSESAKDETVEEARTPRFVPIEEGAKKFVPLNTSSTTKPAAPTPKVTARTQPAEDFSTTDPMGGDLGSAIMGAAAPREKKVYTGSVFDTQPLPPAEFDPREAERLSNRAYAEATTRPPRRQFEMKATPEAQTRERTGTEIYKDTVLEAFQGGVGVLKGITDNINAGNNPASEGLEATSLFFERLKTPQLRGQAAMRQAQIERARENQGEIAATRVAFNTMFSPAGAGVVAKGAGSMIPSLGMSMLGLGVKSMAAANALSNAGDAANQAAEQLKKIKPEEWSNNEVYQTLREKGLSHKDAVAMLVPFYVVPAQATGFGTGYLSGRTGLEKSLAGKAEGTALKRGLSELAGEQVETLAPQFVGNLTAKTVDERVNPFAGLGQAAIETAAGALPGSLISAAAKQGQPTATEDITPPAPPAITPSAPPAIPMPPDSGLGEMGTMRPGEDLKPLVLESIATPPVTPKVAVNVDEKIESLTQDIVNTTGIPEEDARVIATQRVQREEDAKLKALEPRIKSLTDEYIAAGNTPEDAKKIATAQIKQEEEYDLEAAQVETQAGTRGADNVTRFIGETAGTSASMAGQPSTNVPAQGVGGPEPSGVVYAGQPASEPTAGAGPQLSALGLTRGTVTPEAVSKLSDEQLKTELNNITLKDNENALVQAELTKRQQGTAIDQLSAGAGPQPSALINTLNEPKLTEEAGQPTTEAAVTETPETELTNAAIETVAEPKKRGRPAADLETREANAAERKKKGAEYTKAERQFSGNKNSLLSQLESANTPIDEAEIENEEALAQAQEDKRAEKAHVINQLLDIEEKFRGTALGKRVKAVLNDKTKISQPEIDKVKRGREIRKKTNLEDLRGTTQGGTSILASAQNARVGEPEAAFSKFTNGAQALSHIIKTGDGAQRRLAKRLRRFVVGVKFVVIEEGQELPEQLQKNLKYWDRSRGLYIEDSSTKERTVYVRGESSGEYQGANNITVLHELLHAATNVKLGQALNAINRGFSGDTKLVRAYEDLLRTMNSAKDEFNDLARQGKLPEHISNLARYGEVFEDPKEFVAYGMSDPEFQKFLMGAYGYEQETSFFSQFVDAIRRLLGMEEDQYNALSDLIVVTDKILNAPLTADMRLAEYGLPQEPSRSAINKEAEEDEEEVAEPAARNEKELQKAYQIANEKFNQSKLGEEYAKGVKGIQLALKPKAWIPAIQSLYKSGSYELKDILTRLPTTDFLAELAAKDVPELTNTNKLLQKMNGMMQTLLKAAGELTTDIDRAYRKDKTLREKLDRITKVSTLAEYDPSDSTQTVRNKELDLMYNALGSEGQTLYKGIKNHFENLSALLSKLLDDQITQSGLPIAEQANLIKKIRAMYETGTKITPFFPLVREGDFWLGIGSGKTRKFFTFETMGKRDRALDGFVGERVKQKPGESAEEFQKRFDAEREQLLGEETFTYGNDITTLRAASTSNSELLKGVFQAIESTSLAGTDAMEKLKDAVYQVYLQTMPERSFRKQFIHRKGVTGFRTDLLRDVAASTSKMAVQLARVKYSPLLRNSISQARDSIKNRPDMEPYVNAMNRRVRQELAFDEESTGEKIAGVLNKASYIFYLGGLSSALLQPLSIFQTGIPILASKYGAIGAATEMTKMLALWNQTGIYRTNRDGSRSWVMPSAEHAKGLTPEQRKAVRAMIERNVSTSTYAHSIFDYKNTPSGNYSHPVAQLGKDTVNTLVLGGLMHTTERMSREAMFLASFNLNRKAGKSFEESVDAATQDTNESLGNYGQYNRPEFMKGAIGKVLTQFMMYPVYITLFLGRNFVEMARPMNGRTRAEAAGKFFGTLGTTFVLAGAVGLPMFSTVMGLLGWMWEQAKDDDWPEDLKSMSYELWWREKWLPEQLGEAEIGGAKISDIIKYGVANAATGLDISSRTSLNNLWMRDSKEYATVRENAMAMAMEKAGPSANMILSMAEAYEAFMLGDYEKGVGKMAPAGFRNFVNAHKYWTEGAKDNKGAQILSKDAFTTGELIGQAVGFRSDLLANTQYVTFKVIGLQQKIINERNRILSSMDREYRKGNAEGYAKYFKEGAEFNKKFPSFAIETEDIINSLESRQELRAKSWRGFNLTEKNVPLLGEALVESRRAADKKEGRE